MQLWDLHLGHPVWARIQSRLRTQAVATGTSEVVMDGHAAFVSPQSANYTTRPASLDAVTLPSNYITAAGHWEVVPECVPWGAGCAPFSAGSSFKLSVEGVSALYYSRWGPLGDQWGGNLLSPGVRRFGPHRADLLSRGLQARLAYFNPHSCTVMLDELEAVVVEEPASRWCLVAPLWQGELQPAVRERLRSLSFAECSEAAGLLPDMQRHREGSSTTLHGRWRVWVRTPPISLVPSATLMDLTPPTKEEVSAKEQAVREAAKWEPILLNVDAFKRLPFSPEVQQLVVEVPVPYLGERHYEEIAPYPWKLPEHKQLAANETERYLACQALVRAADVGVEVMKCSSWVVVVKGGKTRCCLDLSKLVNPWVPSVPFSLPRFSDVCNFATPGTYLLAYDLRDFFFLLQLRRSDWPLFGVRHPGTGEMLCCARVPFGYVEAPHVACAVSEGVANELRRRGVECLCFVDDFLLKGGDTYQEALQTACVFEELMDELEFQWAPHKKVGPSHQVVFLGIGIDTRPEHFCFRLPVNKTLAVLAELDKFLGMLAEGATECEAAALAGLVGRLAFANNVVPGAQLFLRDLYDALSAAFVCYSHGKPWVRWGSKPVPFTSYMWDDVRWWRTHLTQRSHWSISPRSHLRGMVKAGTDVSTFQGGGQLMLPQGTEELVVEWNGYETTQHINWRECCMVWWLLNAWSTALQYMLVVF